MALRPRVRHPSLLLETIAGPRDPAEEGGHESQVLQLFVARGDPELRKTSFPVDAPRCEESRTVSKSHGDGQGNVGQVGQREGVRGSLPFCVPNFLVRGGSCVSLFTHANASAAHSRACVTGVYLFFSLYIRVSVAVHRGLGGE